MADLDAELLERAVRWCAEAGRQVSRTEVRAALARLSWDALLAARALLADPPPARPLGPLALADMARGASAQQAAEREREGRYLPETTWPEPSPPATGREAVPRRSSRRGARTASGPRVRRARDRLPVPAELDRGLPLLDELFRAGGRSVLERLLRRRGAVRPALVSALAQGWRRADGRPLEEADLGALLEAHGMSRAFERRERAGLMHALRAAGGVRTRAAAALGMTVETYGGALRRLGAEGEAEAVREERRAALRGRATLSERARLLLADEERLGDLGILDEMLADLRARLPEHLRALRPATADALPAALARSLALSRPAVEALVRRLGLGLWPERPAVPERRPRRRGPSRSAAPRREPGRRP